MSFYAGFNGNLYLDIMRDSEIIISGNADYESIDAPGLVTHGMSTVVIECNVGEVVWVRCAQNSDFMFGDSYRPSHFSGFLLQRFS